MPQYCYHPGLSIPASCRICLVEVEGLPKLVPALPDADPRRDGRPFAKSTKAVANQKQVMEYLLINHPLDCPVCDQAGECSLQDYSYEYGRSQSRFEEDKAKKPKKDVGENVMLYTDRCIMCTRCVRFTREVSGHERAVRRRPRPQGRDRHLPGQAAQQQAVAATSSTSARSGRCSTRISSSSSASGCSSRRRRSARSTPAARTSTSSTTKASSTASSRATTRT